MSQTKVSNTFIDNNFPFRNIMINGDMNVAQRGTSTTGYSSTGYVTCDRIKVYNNGHGGAFTITQTADGPGVFGLTKCFKMACTTADTSTAASEYVFLATVFETQHLQHLRKGESDAKKLYLSFYAKGDAAVTYVAEVYDNEHDRVQSQTFAVTTDWQRFTFEIPADTNGETFDNDNSAGLSIHWWLHGGSDYTSGTLSGSWANRTNANRAAGIGSVLASTSRTFFLTGVQLELGGVSDFEQVPFDVNLQRCRRYLQRVEASGTDYGSFGVGAAANSTSSVGAYHLNPNMRAVPTLVTTGTASNYTVFNGSTNVDACTSVPAINGGGGTGSQVRLEFISSGNLTAGQALEQLGSEDVAAYLMFDAEL
tara:strand:+ start:31 stop:1131 length:1101 start_codon:yes stop_codon:yes gene_type:complete